jgi:FkbM family methyltransferase
MMTGKDRFRTGIPHWVHKSVARLDRLLDPYFVRSYSQEGEDLLLRRVLNGQTTGFYVDIGAHHPMRFSNTYLFYKLGWRGINVDAMPGSMELFQKVRPRDINIEAAISETEQVLEYYMMDDPALNGFVSEVNLEVYMKSGRKLLETRPIRTQTMRTLLESYLQGVQEIDFLSVDVEGLDLQVLRSNDWKRFRPRFILTEAFPPSAAEALRQFLGEQGYRCIASTVTTLLFSSI